MKNEKLNQLTKEGLTIFDKLARAYAYNNIPILMADHIPQRGGILSEFVSHGGKAFMAGGQTGQQFFKNVPQYTLSYDTFTSRDLSSIDAITSLFPKSLVQENFATFCYTHMGDRLWTRGVQKHVGGNLVASNEQNFRSFFEEKTNLLDILRLAGLDKNIIPTKLLRGTKPLSDAEATFLYEKLKSEEGKIVIQCCGEGVTERGGGKTTEIVSSLKDFKKVVCSPRESYLKIASYIRGCNSNLSMCVGNTLPNSTMLGAVKGELLPDESRFSTQTLFNLYKRGQELGINLDNIVVNVHPATLKMVGCKELTDSPTNGVGNQLNYNFGPKVMDEIYTIGTKLGTLMALCGKVGLCGLDLIVTQNGHVYINELNDRQQGPTESASLNNELNGLPGIHREAFIMNYADLNKPEVITYLTQMHKYSRELYYESYQIPSPFYLKMHTLRDSVATRSISVGDYHVTQTNNGQYNWNLNSPLNFEETPEVDITQKETFVRINTVSAKEGDFFPKDSQFLRINGISNPNTSPFTINKEGESVLSEEWKAPIKALYQATLQPVQTNDSFVSNEDFQEQ